MEEQDGRSIQRLLWRLQLATIDDVVVQYGLDAREEYQW